MSKTLYFMESQNAAMIQAPRFGDKPPQRTKCCRRPRCSKKSVAAAQLLSNSGDNLGKRGIVCAYYYRLQEKELSAEHTKHTEKSSQALCSLISAFSAPSVDLKLFFLKDITNFLIEGIDVMGFDVNDASAKVQEPPPPPPPPPAPPAQVDKPEAAKVDTAGPTDKANTNQLAADYRRNEIEGRLAAPATEAAKAPAAAPDPDPAKVEEATKYVKNKLDESGWFNDVTHSELKDIENKLGGLTSKEASAVLKNLSDNDIKHWADELNSGGILGTGGYDKGEKEQLFKTLAGKLDGEQLARMAKGLSAGNDGLNTGFGYAGFNPSKDGQAFGAAIAANAPDSVKADFVRAAARNGGDKDPAVAVAMAEAIGGLKNNPAELNRLIGSTAGAQRNGGLTQAQLNRIAEAASQEKSTTYATGGYGASTTVTYDPAPLRRMLDAVASAGNADTKARVFEAGATQLKKVEEAGGIIESIGGVNRYKGDATQQIRDGLTGILNKDTVGTVSSLEHQFRDGKGLAAYAKSMINAGQDKQLGTFISRLLEGNGNTQNPIDRFGQQVTGSDGKPHYKNAGDLGYFVGAIHAATSSITGDRDKQANIVKNIFGSIAGAVGATGPGAGVAAAIVNGLTAATVDEVTSRLNDGTTDLRTALRELAFPHDPKTGDTYEGAAEADYDSAAGRVIDANK